MRSLPIVWTGEWKDAVGRTLLIKPVDRDRYKVSVKDSNGSPFKIDTTGLSLVNTETTDMDAALAFDTHGQLHLQVEVGIGGIGPTYRLYFVVQEADGHTRLADEHDPPGRIHIKPDIGMGLYDEWEDDLGVPWALPLHDWYWDFKD